MGIFEKAGIKEVANVTFSKIDRVTETFETQRTIKISSALKSIMKTTMVYPIVDGVGSDEGFQAFVFTKADILRGANYPCDDTKTGSSAFTYSTKYGQGADMTITTIMSAGATLTLPSGVTAGDITLTNGATLIESTEEVIGTYVYSGVAEFTYVDSTSVNTHQFTYEEQKIGRKVVRLKIKVSDNNKGSNDIFASRRAFVEYIRKTYKPDASKNLFPIVISTKTGDVKVNLNGEIYISSDEIKTLDSTQADKLWNWLFEIVKEKPELLKNPNEKNLLN